MTDQNYGQARVMANMTVAEMREALAECQTVILPIGCVEQHGYHLPLSVDVHNATELALRTAARTGSFVAPTLPYNYSGGELPGTINVNPHVVALLVAEICAAMARQGFMNILLFLGHGGTESVQCIDSGVDMFLRQSPQHRDVAVCVVKFWELCETVQQAFADRDYHAGYIETSLMMYWKPELVRPTIVQDQDWLAERMRDNPDNYQQRTKPVDHPLVAAHVSQHPEIEVGVMGYPERATPQLGKAICEEAVETAAKIIREIELKRSQPS